MTSLKKIETKLAPQAIGPYSQAVLAAPFRVCFRTASDRPGNGEIGGSGHPAPDQPRPG